MFNKVILIGNLTRDVELRYTPSGTAVAKFGLATNRVYSDPVTKEKKQEVMFIDITIFGRAAETSNQYIKRGSQVLVEGRLSFNQWVDNSGQKRSKHEIIAENVKFLGGRDNSQTTQNDYYQNNNSQSNNYNNNQMAQNNNAPQQQMQQSTQQKENIPSIDIDEEEIPF